MLFSVSLPPNCSRFRADSWRGLWRAALLALLATLAVVRTSAAEDVAVPVNLQADLLAKVIEYDRSFPARAGERAQVLIVMKGGNPDSARVASAMQTALGRRDQIAGLPHDEQIVAYITPTDLAAACRERNIAVIYFGPGFGENEVVAIRAVLDGVDVLSVASVPQYVEQGIVLGFDLISGRPKLLFNLTQAKKQHVAIRGEALKLMKVFE
jgi:hypothetical protein